MSNYSFYILSNDIFIIKSSINKNWYRNLLKILKINKYVINVDKKYIISILVIYRLLIMWISLEIIVDKILDLKYNKKVDEKYWPIYFKVV